jgi:hypothetical protein
MLNLNRQWNRWLAALALTGWALLMVWLGCTWVFGTGFSAAVKTAGVVITGAWGSGCLGLLLLSVVIQDIRRGETAWVTKEQMGGDALTVSYRYVAKAASWHDHSFSYLAVLAVKFLIFLGCMLIATALVWLTSARILTMFR